MNNTAVVKIFRTFSKKEIKDFEKFVDSPYFNTSEATARLFKEIKEFYPSFDGKDFTKEKMFAIVYDKSKYNEVLMRKLISNLLKLSEEFLIAEEGKKGSEESYQRILKQYLNRNLTDQFDSKFPRALSYLENKLKDVEDFYYLHNLYSLLTHNYAKKSEYRKAYTASSSGAEYFLLYFQLFASNMIVVQNDFKNELKIEEKSIYNDSLYGFIDSPELVAYIKKSIPVYADLLELFLIQMKLSKSPDEETFMKFKELTFENIHSLDHRLKRYLMVSLNNHFQRFEKKLKHPGNVEMEILDFELKENLLSYYGNSIHIGDFTHKLYILLQAGEIKRAEEFNETYSHKLDPKLRRSGHYYGLASISFSKKNFKESIGYLVKTEHRAFPLNYYVRRLTVQNYVELKDVENILTNIDSFKHFLTESSDVNTNVKMAFQKFLKYCKALAVYFSNEDKPVLNSVFTEYCNDSSVQMGGWLRRKFCECLE